MATQAPKESNGDTLGALAPKGAAKYLGISRAALYNAWTAKTGPRRFYIGKSVRVSMPALQDWIAEREAAAQTK